MSINGKSSERELLRLYNIAFTNTESNPVIKEKLTGRYDSDYFSNGKKLLEDTEDLYKISLSEREKLSAAYEEFSIKRAELDKAFKLLWKLTRIVFKKRKLILDRLAVSGSYPSLYGPWIAAATKFFSELSTDTGLLEQLSRFNITGEDISNGMQMVNEVTAAYAFYTNLKGESQKTTELKNASFEKLNEWMRDFYEVARVTFRDQPQQLESFGIVVKN